jgi:hypothetical protein
MTEPRRRTVRIDILEELENVMNNNMRPGTGNSDINVFSIEYPVRYGLLVQIRNEIVQLRKAAEQHAT